MNDNQATKRVFLLTHTRTASHLLQRMLSEQPNCLYGSHFFLSPRELRRNLLLQGPLRDSDLKQREELKSTLNDCYLEFEKFLAKAEAQNKIAFVHNQPHTMLSPAISTDLVYGTESSAEEFEYWKIGEKSGAPSKQANITVLPDEVFTQPGTVPIVNFRHPVLVIDGIYRGLTTLSSFQTTPENTRKLFKVGGHLKWQRMMYDFYLDNGITPVLVEADDYMGPQKEAILQALCRQAGLDETKVIYSWAKATSEEISALPLAHAESFKTLLASEGVLSGKDIQGRDLDTEKIKWRRDYGEEWAEIMKDLVEKAMPDYEYLRARRLTVQD